MNQFRTLMLVVLSSGALAGFALFAVQHFTVVPLITTAETYEAPHEEHRWQPAEGWERTTFTALTTILTAIAFAALLFGSLSLAGARVNARRGALCGLAAFACFSLAPALGLPPQPPGAAAAGIFERQIWWLGTVAATAAGLWLLFGRKRSWLLRIAGVICLGLPHLIGAPAPPGPSAVPSWLLRRFAIASLATTGMFWLLLGTIGGFVSNRMRRTAVDIGDPML